MDVNDKLLLGSGRHVVVSNTDVHVSTHSGDVVDDEVLPVRTNTCQQLTHSGVTPQLHTSTRKNVTNTYAKVSIHSGDVVEL